jgi:hypothetical protein
LFFYKLSFLLTFSCRLGLDLSYVVHWRMQRPIMCMFGFVSNHHLLTSPLILYSISTEFLYSYDRQYSKTLL